jgi:hypothetical protein
LPEVFDYSKHFCESGLPVKSIFLFHYQAIVQALSGYRLLHPEQGCAPAVFYAICPDNRDSNMLLHVAQQKQDDPGKGFVFHHFESLLVPDA